MEILDEIIRKLEWLELKRREKEQQIEQKGKICIRREFEKELPPKNDAKTYAYTTTRHALDMMIKELVEIEKSADLLRCELTEAAERQKTHTHKR